MAAPHEALQLDTNVPRWESRDLAAARLLDRFRELERGERGPNNTLRSDVTLHHKDVRERCSRAVVAPASGVLRLRLSRMLPAGIHAASNTVGGGKPVRVSVVRRYTFEAAHSLEWHNGKCRRLHGHSYKVEVTVTRPLDDRGVVIEFSELDDAVDPLIQSLDHRDLTDIVANPTAERIAHHIATQLSEAEVDWSSVRLWETDRASALVER